VSGLLPGNVQLAIVSKEDGPEVVVLPFASANGPAGWMQQESAIDEASTYCSNHGCAYTHISSQPWKVQLSPLPYLAVKKQTQDDSDGESVSTAEPRVLTPPASQLGDCPGTRRHSLSIGGSSQSSGGLWDEIELEKCESQPGSATDVPPPRPMRNKFHKTRICRFFLEGKCRKKNACNYAHGEQETCAQPDLSKTKMCPLVVSGMTCTSADCMFAHDPAELRVVQSAKARTLS